MRILIACEESAELRDRFAIMGHYAMSCDLQPSRTAGLHYQGNVFDILYDGWDMMIAHPPCTYIANVSAIHYDVKKWGQKAIDRTTKRDEAIKFFLKIQAAPIEKICIENPLPGAALVAAAGKYTQMVHPYYFGDPFSKKTCLWLKNLPKLYHNDRPSIFDSLVTHVHKGEFNKGKNGRTNAKWYHDLSPKDRAKIRSKTFPGIAQAMADQWGKMETLQKAG